MLIEKYTEYKAAINNIFYLGTSNLIMLLFPIITYPYLIKTLGLKLYGDLLYYQGIAYLLAVFISYGFNLSATREIAKTNQLRNEINKIYSITFIAKFILFLFVYSMYIVIGIVFFRSNIIIYLLSSGPIFMELFYPVWFYQGLNKLKYPVYMGMVNRIIYILLLFYLVKDESDMLAFSVINMVYFLSMSFVTFIFPFLKMNVSFYRFSFSDLSISYKNGWNIFLSSFFIAMKDRLNIIFIGSIFDSASVVIYDLAMKIMSIISIPQNVIINSFFSKVSELKNHKVVNRLILIISAFNIVLIIVTTIFVYYFIDIIIHKEISLDNKKTILFIVFSLFPMGISSCISKLYFIPFSFDRILKKTVFINFALYVLYLILFYFFIEEKNIFNFSLVVVFTYCSELIIRFTYLYYIFKNKLLIIGLK